MIQPKIQEPPVHCALAIGDDLCPVRQMAEEAKGCFHKAAALVTGGKLHYASIQAVALRNTDPHSYLEKERFLIIRIVMRHHLATQCSVCEAACASEQVTRFQRWVWFAGLSHVCS